MSNGAFDNPRVQIETVNEFGQQRVDTIGLQTNRADVHAEAIAFWSNAVSVPSTPLRIASDGALWIAIPTQLFSINQVLLAAGVAAIVPTIVVAAAGLPLLVGFIVVSRARPEMRSSVLYRALLLLVGCVL